MRPGRVGEPIIAIVGDLGSGKSHYLTVLVEKIIKGRFGRDFDMCISFGDSGSQRVYDDEYRRPLFGERSELARGGAHTPPRLVFQLSVPGSTLMLIFYDVARRQILDGGGEISDAVRYLWSASALIYLVNPADVGAWQGYLDGEEAYSGREADAFYGSMVREFKKLKRNHHRKRIKTPLAVCISQFDRFAERREAAGLDGDLFSPEASPVRKGHIDRQALESESQRIEDFMRRSGGSAGSIAGMARADFANTRFFAVSSLGASPDGPRGLVDPIVPNRVEVPFFWILSKLGIL